MSTIRKLIKGSLRLINVISTNEEPSADDVDVTLKAFNGLLDSLGNDILNIFTFTPYKFLLVSGQETYKLGPAVDSAGDPTGADWVTDRPMRIEQAKLLLYPSVEGSTITIAPSTLVRPLRALSMSEYAGLRLRMLPNQWPTGIYDDGAMPCRNLSFWPVPTQANAVEVWLWDPLMIYESLDTELNLPPGYERYLRFKLAVEIAPEFGKEISQTVIDSMKASEEVVKKMNQSHPRAGSSLMGAALSSGGTGFVYSDTYPIGSMPRSW
jgi:hypothetical protein